MPSVTRTVLPAVSAAKFSRVLCSIMPWSVMSRKEEECGWKRAKVAFGKRHVATAQRSPSLSLSCFITQLGR